MVDDFARQGYYTYLVDYLSGDAVAPDAMNSGDVSKAFRTCQGLSNGSNTQFDLMGWLSHHGEEATHAALDPVLDGLKEEGVSKFAAVGYCFGVRTGDTPSASRPHLF
jgi:dienelactone hydrolase